MRADCVFQRDLPDGSFPSMVQWAVITTATVALRSTRPSRNFLLILLTKRSATHYLLPIYLYHTAIGAEEGNLVARALAAAIRLHLTKLTTFIMRLEVRLATGRCVEVVLLEATEGPLTLERLLRTVARANRTD